jgi:LexA-binding, inner membrane-associated putative hydrolase
MNIFGHIGITLGIFLLICMFIPLLKKIIDFKYLAIGALLPDLIDKPLGWIIFPSLLLGGRTICHTFVFSFALLYIGLSMYEKISDRRIVSLAAGSFFHLMEDQMWQEPRILFWPLLGWGFPKSSIDNALLGIKELIEIFDPGFGRLTIRDIYFYIFPPRGLKSSSEYPSCSIFLILSFFYS